MSTLQKFLDAYILVRHDDHDHDHDDDEDEDTSSTIVAKIVAMCVLFSLSFLMGCIPLQLSKWFKWEESPKNNKLVNFLLCIGGGVLICTTFLHLLPEVNEQLTELQEDKVFPELQFHFPELLMCIGFLIMYFVEECVHVYLEKRKMQNFTTLHRTLSIRRGEKDSEKKENETVANDIESSYHTHSHVDHSHVIFEDAIMKGIRGFLIVFALSVHELFEGFAVGLESSASSVWYMFGAVSAHKLVIAFCIGVELVTIKTRKLLCILYVFTFAVVSPLGIGLGIILTGNAGSGTDVASVILQGLASGTLLYVVFFEILQGDRKHGLRQWLAVVVGFAIMFIITLFSKYTKGNAGGGHMLVQKLISLSL